MKSPFSARSSFAISICSLSIGIASTIATATSRSATPEQLQVPAGQTLMLKAIARGSQIYTCQVKPGAVARSRYEWVLKAPDARLFDERNQQQGKHYLGPTWEWNDGSKVVAKVKAKADAPSPNAIPWLLLEAQTSETPASGILTAVKWIQRVNTTGGKAPQSGCDRTIENLEVRVKYTADYYFYGNRPRSASMPLQLNLVEDKSTQSRQMTADL